MEKNRNPDAAEIALPVNAFPVHSGFREKGKENDLAAVNVDISMSIPAPKSKINTHLSIHLGRDQFGLVRGRVSAVGHVPFDQWTTTHDRRGLLSLMSSGGRWYGCARGKRAIVTKRGRPRRIGERRFLLSRSIWMILSGRRSKVYHQLHHGGTRYFMVFVVFMSLNANKRQRKKR